MTPDSPDRSNIAAPTEEGHLMPSPFIASTDPKIAALFDQPLTDGEVLARFSHMSNLELWEACEEYSLMWRALVLRGGCTADQLDGKTD